MEYLPTLVTFAFALAFSPLTASAATPGFKSIFNGKDLTGWDGTRGLWSARDGAITGQTTASTALKANTFLVYQTAQPANFELRLSFRLTPNNDEKKANSGVQYRSKVTDPATFVVAGYQADIDSDGKYTGMLYEEKGRGILMAPGEKVRITAAPASGSSAAKDTKDAKKKKQKATVEKLGAPSTAAEILAAYKIGEWNQLTIIAQGNRLQHFLNGKLTADVTDDDPALAPQSGVIALQLHTGPPMTIQFKDVQLKTLP